MKHGKKILLFLLAIVCLAAEMAPLHAEAEDKKYTVRIYPGNVGTISGGIYYNDHVGHGDSIGVPDVVPDDGYFVKGIRESGREIFSTGFTVTRDQDYVIAYGVESKKVAYTVHYLERGTNAKLAAPATFYAEVGDRPVTAYIYIDGYQNYRRTTKTLSSDTGSNQLYVYYVKPVSSSTTTTTYISSGGSGSSSSTYWSSGSQYSTGPSSVSPSAFGQSSSDQNTIIANTIGQNSGDQSTNGQTAGGQDTANPSEINGLSDNSAVSVSQYAETGDILDLDQSLPSSDIGESGTPAVPSTPIVIEPNQRSSLPNWALIACAVLLVLLIAALYWYLLFYRKMKKYASNGADDGSQGIDANE